ncbi:hypothetical protein BGW36DRAFT_363736 [Talaromyces proteolyticus]|uniref:Uncharacterized protein n=1 Tax=Talaromyces proteolyticus TaxID=1131652 RepID=A0AAD4PWD3_9EURO|nr:uncharacterized protein BGW36DRAFT_363736 [Talaromyces proteolyticus]KAH8691404.1 hypothetical protein BGW36DRAFT_363736 [Talaromyces proteolyticus]
MTFVHQRSFNWLNSVDQCRFIKLQKACQRAGFDVFLANITKTNNGGLIESYDESYYNHGGLGFSHVLDRNGTVVEKGVPFPETMVIPDGVFDRNPHEGDSEGFTGNAGASTTHFVGRRFVLASDGDFIRRINHPSQFRFMFDLHILKHGSVNVKVVPSCYISVLTLSHSLNRMFQFRGESKPMIRKSLLSQPLSLFLKLVKELHII